MAKSIDSLLKKRGWTGADVGRALLASIVHDIKHQRDPDYKPLFSQADFDKMEESLSTEKDYLVYGVYRDIYGSLIDAYNRGQGLAQQFQNGYSRHSHSLVLCQKAEEALSSLEDSPLIVTQAQYDRLKQQAEESLRGIEVSFASIMFTVLSDFLEEPGNAPEAIRKEIEAAKGEPTTNQRILSAYNYLYGEGYYTLPDGRRSDQMSKSEWVAALEELYFSTHRLIKNGKPASKEETAKHYNLQRMTKLYELYFKGADAVRSEYNAAHGLELDATDEEIMSSLEDMLGFADGYETTRREKMESPCYPLQRHIRSITDPSELKTFWTYYEAPPEGLTKYDILADCLSLYNGNEMDNVTEEEQLAEFEADYPKLFKALVAYLKKAIPAFKNIKPSSYLEPALSWGELADMGFADYKSLIEPKKASILEVLGEEDTFEAFRRRRQALWSGIAVIQEASSSQIDENGDYIEPKSPLTFFDSLDSLAEDELRKEELKGLRDGLFVPALTWLYGFNALMKILADCYDIDGMDTLQFNLSGYERQIEGFNSILYMLYGEVYGNKAERDRKREIIRDLFSPIDTEALKPTAETIAAVTQEIAELGFTSKARKKLKGLDDYIGKLTRREA